MHKRELFRVLVILIIIFIFTSGVDAAIPAAERAALIALYNSTNGDNWTDNSGWKTPPLHSDGFTVPGTEGKWKGITLTNDHVDVINLYKNNVSGILPVELANLTELQSLEIYDNKLTGTIPPELGSLTRLTLLKLGVNRLSGTIPPQLGALSRLMGLDLGVNQLTGTIPAEIWNLRNLTGLYLHNNMLTGGIPPEIGNLEKLQSLVLAVNELTGTIPGEIGTLGQLNWLQLGWNKLSGTIPPEIGNLSNLEYLSIYSNELSGSIPTELGKLSKLKEARLYSNQLNGKIPAELGNLGQLRLLYLTINKLSGTIPRELAKLSNLEVLDISGNMLTGTIPSEFSGMSRLKELNVAFNELSGPIPPVLQYMIGLTNLRIDVNHFEGPIPAWIGNLTELELFWLCGNKIVGKVPREITRLTRLSSDVTGLYSLQNGLYTDNPEVRAFLDDKESNWQRYQTVPPTKMAAAAVSEKAIKLSWTPIDYIYPYNKGYEIYYGTSSGGPWTYAGITNGFLTSSYTITGLMPGTTYYAMVRARTEPHVTNKNTVLSDESEEVSATTLLPVGTNLLTVKSSPYNGIGITVSAVDYNGQSSGSTNFTRLYNTGTVVNLTAPATFGGNNFIKWTLDGMAVTGTAIQVAMDSNHTAVVYYEQVVLPETYTLTVQSYPDAGADVSLTPNDNNGSGNGSTSFTRIYNESTVVTLTAPSTSNGKVFSRWSLDGSNKTGSILTLTMNSNHTAVAVYEDETPPGESYTLTIESTHSHGCPVTVSPADENGYSDGTTKFTRLYTEGTNVTLTTPAEYNDQTFDHWKLDGQKVNSSVTLQVTVTGNHKIKAYYVTPARPGLVVRPGKINFGYIIGEEMQPVQTMRVTLNNAPAEWTAGTDVDWITIDPSTGYGSTEVSVLLNEAVASLDEEQYSGTIIVTAPDADHSPQTVTVNLKVFGSNQSTAEPIGEFATPTEGSTVYGSVPVTGWVIDDIGVESLKIYREGKNQKDLIFIGDAVFVEGARPDVEESFPDYPENYRAGWGYMLLTNFFPESGNGTFTIHAVAKDVEGNAVTLGTRTITCDNANSVSPFGAIDTPGQGTVASGKGYINWGWVLTPQPNSIPEDGTTVSVWVDGINIGNPTYNIYREDIAVFFPGLANSNGAAGYFYLDTTGYDDGVHSIQWVATDSGGNTDGIGSRYFIIQNSSKSRKNSAATTQRARSVQFTSVISENQALYGDVEADSSPVYIKKGYFKHNEPSIPVFPGKNQCIKVNIIELEPLEIHFFSSTEPTKNTSSRENSILVPMSQLPHGSTLDSKNGIFYWQPGLAFSGKYRLKFLVKSTGGTSKRKTLQVNIHPRYSQKIWKTQ